jgi:hypothetical protein
MVRVPPQTLPSTPPVDRNQSVFDRYLGLHTIRYMYPVSIVLFSIFDLPLTLLLPISRPIAISLVTDPILIY